MIDLTNKTKKKIITDLLNEKSKEELIEVISDSFSVLANLIQTPLNLLILDKLLPDNKYIDLCFKLGTACRKKHQEINESN